MQKTLSILLLSCVALLGACSKNKDSEQAQRLGALCTQATDDLKRDAQVADMKTFQMMVSNALLACSGGCDAGDDPSCKALDGHVEKLCKVSASMCTELCKTSEGKSLKDATCRLAGKK